MLSADLVTSVEGKIIAGITARSVLEFSGIPWNYLELFLELQINLHKIPLEKYCLKNNLSFPLFAIVSESKQ